MAGEQRSFEGVSAATWQRVREVGRRNHGTVFDQGDAARGTATTPTPVGSIVLDFEFDAEAERITYTIVRKPMLAASALIWGGIAATIERLRQG